MMKALLPALVALGMTLGVTLGTAVPAMADMSFSDRDLVRTITKGDARIKYYRQNGKISNHNTMRVCLLNMTPYPKSMVWTRITPRYVLGNLVAGPNGGGDCAAVPIDRRIEWNFVDGTEVKGGDAMSLGGFGQDLVAFEWMWTRDNRVRECQEQRCNVLAEVGVDNAGDPEVSSQYGIATLICLAFCEAQ